MTNNFDVSNKTLLIDIENTKKELMAYQMLEKGYAILAELPENIQSGMSRSHNVNSTKYHVDATLCNDFLNKLLEIANNRGLEIEKNKEEE